MGDITQRHHRRIEGTEWSVGGATGIQIAIVHRLALFTQTLSAYFTGRHEGIEVAYSGPDPNVALGVADTLDVVLLEGRTSSDLVARFDAAGVPVLMFSESTPPAHIRETFMAGASGIVSKEASPEELVAMLWAVAAGEVLPTPELSQAMTGPAAAPLSQQELQATRLFVSGITLKAVARQMSVSPHTAKEYLDRARAKYAAQGRTARTRSELLARAREDGLIAEE